MNQREKILLIIVIAILGLYGGSKVFNDILMGPVNQRNSQIAAINHSIDEKNDRFDEIVAAQQRLSRWKQQSLPPDEYDAAALYQDWLLHTAEEAKLSDINVDRTRITPRHGIYAMIGMTITAKGTLGQVADFLFAFQRTDLLQKIKMIDLQSTGNQGDPALNVTINLEALSLAEVDERQTLFAEGVEKAVSEQMAGKVREQYALLTEHNPFVRGYNGPPKPDPKPAEPTSDKPGIDLAEQVRFVGFVAKGNARDAMLYDKTSKKDTLLTEGKEFDVAGIQGRVITIGTDYFTMQIKDDVWRLELGQNLRQIVKVSSNEQKPADPSTVSTGS